MKFPRAVPAGRGSKGLGVPKDICHHWHETYLLCKGFKNMSYRPWFFTNLHTQSSWLFNAPSTWSIKRCQIMKSLLAPIFHLAFQKVISLHAFECIFLSCSATRPIGPKILWSPDQAGDSVAAASALQQGVAGRCCDDDGKGYWSNWGATDSLCFPFRPLQGVM